MSNKKPVPKSETYNIRLKASEKQLIQQAAERAGLGTAEYWSEVLQAVSYTILRYEENELIPKEEFEKMVGAQVASIVWAGMVIKPEEKPEPAEGDKEKKV